MILSEWNGMKLLLSVCFVQSSSEFALSYMDRKSLKDTVCDQKSALFLFEKIIRHFKNKFDQIFKHGKACYRINLPENYCPEASKTLLSSHLQADKFEEATGTSNNMEHI